MPIDPRDRTNAGQAFRLVSLVHGAPDRPRFWTINSKAHQSIVEQIHDVALDLALTPELFLVQREQLLAIPVEPMSLLLRLRLFRLL